METRDLDALVVGAGVSGLTTAVLLAERGLRVRVWSTERPEHTTSFAAGAMWGPYLVEPIDKVQKWSRASLAQFKPLASEKDTGVRLTAGVEASRQPVAPPDWADQLDEFRVCQRDELPDGFVAGWRFRVPHIDMPMYLRYLETRLLTAGGVLEQKTVNSLQDLAGIAPVAVNCTGIGARRLLDDTELFPVRGQLVVLENPGIDEFFSEDTGPSPDLLHFSPHGDSVVVGGQAVANDWNLEPDLDTAEAILARCRQVEPKLRGARVIGHRVGLRPQRSTVRVDTEQVGETMLIHNYGHGGAGVTLSWGCAAEVAELAKPES